MPPQSALVQRTLTIAIVEVCGWSMMWGFGDSFFGPFAVFLKADDFQMSLLGTLPVILGAVAQLMGASLIERLGRRRRLLVLTAGVQSLGFLPLFWLPFFFPAHGAAITVGLITFMVFTSNLGTPGFNSMMGDLVPENERGRYFAKRSSVAMLVMLASMLTSGRIITTFEVRHQVWLGFGIVFTIAMLARAFSTTLLSRYHEPLFSQPLPGSSISMLKFLRELPHTNFGRFTLITAMMTGASSISAPFFTQYMIRDLHWTKDQFAACTAILLLSQFVFIRWWGHLCDKHGNRAAIVATSMMLPLLPLLWAVTKNFYLILGVQALAGLAWSGFNLACSNFIYDSIPTSQRHWVFSYYNIIQGLFTLVGGSVIGAWLALTMPSCLQLGSLHFMFLSSLPAVFIVSSLLCALGGVLLLTGFKEVRPSEPITSRQILWRILTGEPLYSRITGILSTCRRRG